MILFSQEEINRIMFKFSLIIHAKIPLRKTAEGFNYSLPPAPPRLPPELPESLRQFSIRQFLFEYPESCQSALCRARELLAWRKLHRFCGACREKLIASDHDSGLICPACHAVYYPQLAPAVIVAITRNNGRELLLAHNRNFAGNMYSLIAGFVEAGESVEMAIHREIREETNLQVKNLRYITSQVWPFPNSLMLAFQAEYDSGEAMADGEELSDLGWFTADDHPELPSPGSVARYVIDQIFNLR
jgi:NAD+ diphosphatase